MNRLATVSVVTLTGFMSIFILAACSAVDLPAATAIPTPQAWQVTYPSELAWMLPDFERCLDPAWNAGLILEETQNLNPAGSPAMVVLSWGDVDPQNRVAYHLGSDQLYVVINPELTLSEVSLAMLRGIYDGSLDDWSEIDTGLDGEINAWIYPEHLSIQQVFAASLPGLESSPSLNIAPDVTAMLDAVRQDPHAIGLIPAFWPDYGLQVLPISEWATNNVPIVALVNPNAPESFTAWLSCLATGLSS